MTPDRRLDPDDVLAVSSPSGPRGVYRMNRQTDLFLGADVDAGPAQMVVKHEAMHFNLNNCTQYGQLLNSVGAYPPTSDPEQVGLSGLIEAALLTHETTATCAGAWGVRASTASLMKDYPDYQDYLKLGQRLARDLPPESYAAHIAVFQACRAAMQFPLNHVFPLRMQWGELRVGDLSVEMVPDARLRALEAVLPDLPLLFGDDERAARPLCDGGQADALEDFAAWYYSMSEIVYDSFARELLLRVGVPTTSYNGQLWEAFELREGRSRMLAISRHRDTYYQRARVVEKQPSMVVKDVTDLAAPPWSNKTGFISVRPLARVLKQFDISKAGRTLLESAAHEDFVVTLPQPKTARGTTYVENWVVRDPTQLDTIVEWFPNGLLTSISVSAVNTPWAERWTGPLDRLSVLTLLLDVHPALANPLFDNLLRSRQHVQVNQIKLTGDEHVAAAALRLFEEDQLPPGLITIALSTRDVVADLSDQWSELAGDRLISPDAEWPKEVDFVLSWLIAIEPWFDFDALLATVPADQLP